jgi:hypothetical protein
MQLLGMLQTLHGIALLVACVQASIQISSFTKDGANISLADLSNSIRNYPVLNSVDPCGTGANAIPMDNRVTAFAYQCKSI